MTYVKNNQVKISTYVKIMTYIPHGQPNYNLKNHKELLDLKVNQKL